MLHVNLPTLSAGPRTTIRIEWSRADRGLQRSGFREVFEDTTDDALSTNDAWVTETLTVPQPEASMPLQPLVGLTSMQRDEVEQTSRAEQAQAILDCQQCARRDTNLPFSVGVRPAAVMPWGVLEHQHSICIHTIRHLMGTASRSFAIEAIGHRLVKWVVAPKRLSKSYHNTMTSPEYKYLCARLLSQARWKAELTRASGDQGAYVFGTNRNTCIVIHAEKYSARVGNDAGTEAVRYTDPTIFDQQAM